MRCSIFFVSIEIEKPIREIKSRLNWIVFELYGVCVCVRIVLLYSNYFNVFLFAKCWVAYSLIFLPFHILCGLIDLNDGNDTNNKKAVLPLTSFSLNLNNKKRPKTINDWMCVYRLWPFDDMLINIDYSTESVSQTYINLDKK